MLHTADNEEVRSANSNGSLKEVSEENQRNNNNLSTSEDDWVEVKVPDNHVLDNRVSSLPLKPGSEQVCCSLHFFFHLLNLFFIW